VYEMYVYVGVLAFRDRSRCLLQLREACQPVVGIEAAHQTGAARVGASLASAPAALAGGFDGRSGIEPADAVVVVASETGSLRGTAPADALLVIEGAASVGLGVFGFGRRCGFQGRGSGGRKRGFHGGFGRETGQPVVGVGAAFQSRTARVGASLASGPAGLARGTHSGSVVEPADAVVVVAVETRILRGTTPADALLVIEGAASILVVAFLFDWLWPAGKFVVGVGAALETGAAGVGIDFAFRPSLRAGALWGGTVFQPDERVVVVATVSTRSLGCSAPTNAVMVVQGAAGFAWLFDGCVGGCFAGTGVAGHGTIHRQGLSLPIVFEAAFLRIVRDPIATAAIGIVSIAEGRVVLAGSVVVHGILVVFTLSAVFGTPGFDLGSPPLSFAPIVGIPADPPTVLFVF